MKKLYFYFSLGILLPVTGYSQPISSETIYQIARLDALAGGQYNGQVTFGSLKKYGNFGLGTFSGLDGEMVCLDGHFYQIKTDGMAYPVSGGLKTPFANVTQFHTDQNIKFSGRSMDLSGLLLFLDEELPDPDGFYAIRIDGFFQQVKTRSVHSQTEPYRPLNEVLTGQIEFNYKNIEGTMVGFHFPESVGGANVQGFHFHFITRDRQHGGHLLDCTTDQFSINLDQSSELDIVWPKKEEETFPQH